MKRLFLFLFLFAFLQDVDAQTIDWQEDRKLTWEDYKAQPPVTRTAARTFVGFSFDVVSVDPITGIGQFLVKSFFISDSSWVQPGLEHRDDLLEHEQLHFDLAELYARQIRQLIQGKTPAEAKQIYYAVLPQYRARQRAYDHETRHGINEDIQLYWKEIILSELMLHQ